MKEERNKNLGNLKEKKEKAKNVTSLEVTKPGVSKILLRLILPVILVAILVATIFSVIYRKPQNITTSSNPELAKAMEYPQVKEGEEKINGTEYVQFDAFFLRDLDGDGYAESVRGTCREIGNSDTLYMQLNVLTNGYLKEGATVTINGERGKDRNYSFQTSIVKDQYVKEDYISNDTTVIELKEMPSGSQKLLTGAVTANIGDNINSYSTINSVTFKGTHVETSEEGQPVREIPIEKTVQFNIDWHGTTRCEIDATSIKQEEDIEEALDRDSNKLKLNFYVSSIETQRKLKISKVAMSAIIPEFYGYKPTNVEVVGTNVVYDYDEETMKLTAVREAVVDKETGEITTTVYSSNTFNVNLEYPLEAYTNLDAGMFSINVPVEVYYEGFNNTNDEFVNPHKSNVAEEVILKTYREKSGPKWTLKTYVGEHKNYNSNIHVVSKEKPFRIYLGQSDKEDDDTYRVLWKVTTGPEGKLRDLIFNGEGSREKYDAFIKDGVEESMEDIVSYIGIYFENATDILGEDGYIQIYDKDNDQLVKTFTVDDWDKYTKQNPYKYKEPIKNLTLKTSGTNINSFLKINHIKKIDDDKLTQKYTMAEFYKITDIISYVNVSEYNSEVEIRWIWFCKIYIKIISYSYIYKCFYN